MPASLLLASSAPGFSELPLSAQLVLSAQVLFAAALGALVGLEREMAGKRAGTCTHLLVAASSALAVGVGLLVVDTGDPTRVLQAVVTGVGFIGAGAILRSESAKAPTGLTTATTVFCVAVIGATVTLGAPLLAALVTVLTLVALRGRSYLERAASGVVSRLSSIDDD